MVGFLLQSQGWAFFTGMGVGVGGGAWISSDRAPRIPRVLVVDVSADGPSPRPSMGSACPAVLRCPFRVLLARPMAVDLGHSVPPAGHDREAPVRGQRDVRLARSLVGRCRTGET